MSYYHDGVYVYNMNDPKNPEVIAWYDTYPQNGEQYSGFEGCWGIYPYLPSGNLLAFDMTNGLFVLRMDAAAGNERVNAEAGTDLLIYPNPGVGAIQVSWRQGMEETQILQVVDMGGRVVWEQEVHSEAGENSLTLPLSGENKGIYLVQLTGPKTHICKKLSLH